MTKKELRELHWSKIKIQQLEDHIQELESQAEKITTKLSHDPHSTAGPGDNVAEIVAKIIDIQNDIKTELLVYYNILEQVDKAIKALPDREACLMRLRYINSHTWEQICIDMNYSWRQVHYIHAYALKLLSIA